MIEFDYTFDMQKFYLLGVQNEAKYWKINIIKFVSYKRLIEIWKENVYQEEWCSILMKQCIKR